MLPRRDGAVKWTIASPPPGTGSSSGRGTLSLAGPVDVTTRRVGPCPVGAGESLQDAGHPRAAQFLLDRTSRLFQAVNRVREVGRHSGLGMAGEQRLAVQFQEPRQLADRQGADVAGLGQHPDRLVDERDAPAVGTDREGPRVELVKCPEGIAREEERRVPAGRRASAPW